jgi:tetratricopeptide (TPR) repeat protein
MKRACCVLVVCLLIGVAVVLSVDAQGGEGVGERDPVFEQEIYDRLAKIDPEAAPLFQEATHAMDAGDLAAARQGYEQVLALAPEFPDAVRRLSYVYNRLGDAQTALRYAEQAYAIDPSPYNQLAVASALLGFAQDADKAGQALVHAKAAARALPEDPAAHYTLFYAGLMNEDVEACRQASATLGQIAHTDPMTHYAAAIVAAFDGEWKEAKRELSLAEELGMPVEETREMRQAIRAQARRRMWLRTGAYTFGGWLVSPILPPPQDDKVREHLEAETAKEMSRSTTPYDSHLAPGERIALLERIQTHGPPEENAGPVWDLMADAEALQAEMMMVIKGNVEQRLASAGTQAQVPAQTDVRRPWYLGPRVRSWAALLMILGGFVVIAWGVSISSVPGMVLGGVFVVVGIWIRYGSAIRARIRARLSGKKNEGQSGDSG